MKNIRLLLPIVALSMLVFYACVKMDEVVEPAISTCKLSLEFKKNTAKVSIDTLDNTLFVDDSSVTDPKAARLDMRIVDKSGNIWLFTLRDEASDSLMTVAAYRATGTQHVAMSYMLPGYKPSTYSIDSQAVIITKFDEKRMLITGSFTGRMIDTTRKDTIRLRDGKFTDICYSFRNK